MSGKSASEMRQELQDLVIQSQIEVRNIPERKSDQEFTIPIVEPTRRDIMLGLFWFDRNEVFLLIFSYLLVLFTFEPFTRETLTTEALIIFWGYVGLFFFTMRHSSTSIFQYLNYRAMVADRLRQGKFTVELRFSGMIVSLFLMLLGSDIAMILNKVHIL